MGMPRRITRAIAAVAFGLATLTATGAHAADDAKPVDDTSTVEQTTSGDDARTKEERVNPARTKEERAATLRTKEE